MDARVLRVFSRLRLIEITNKGMTIAAMASMIMIAAAAAAMNVGMSFMDLRVWIFLMPAFLLVVAE